MASIRRWWNTSISTLRWSAMGLTGRLLLLNLILAAIVIPLGYYGEYHEPARYFREGRIMTWLSFFQLLYVGYLSRQVFFARSDTGTFVASHPSAVWLLGCWTFVYLALDEMFRLHENIDRYLFHKLWGMEETPLTDRIDDVIVALYGVVCLVAIFKYRRELLQFLPALPYFICAGLGFVLMVTLDTVTDGDAVLAFFIKNEAQLRSTIDWLGAAEDLVKNLTECFFIGLFASCLYQNWSKESRHKAGREQIPAAEMPTAGNQ